MRVEFNSGLHVLALLRAMIDQENSRHPVNQSDAKVKTIASWSFASSLVCFLGHTLIIIVFFFSQIAMAESPPDIPESLNPALRDVLLRCFESKLDERPPATELLRHPLFTQM